MNSEKIVEVINRIPFLVLLLLYLGSVGYDAYFFITDSTSPLAVKKAELTSVKAANAKLQMKLTELENFARSLEAKKIEIRRSVEEFQNLSATLPDRLDTPMFTKMLATEAKKVDLKMDGLKPVGVVEKDFYSETSFLFSYRGMFNELLVFLQRLANASEVIRVDSSEIKLLSLASARFVEITGTVEVKTYTYLPVKVDEMVKQMLVNLEKDGASTTAPNSKPGSNSASPSPVPSLGPKEGSR